MIFVWRADSLPYDALWDVFCAWISKMAGKIPKNEQICSLEFNNDIWEMKTLFQVMVGRQREFEATLERLRGKDADISCEASEILVSYSNFRKCN